MIPGRKILGRMGYLRDQEGIMNRYIREKAAWDPHLQRTCGFIRESFQGIGVDRVAILGSGWLLDLPLEGVRDEHWSWEFDARGTYRPGTRTRMEVRAIEWR